VKINKSDAVRHTDFGDDVLNATFGKIFGHLSDDAVRAIAFRHSEIRVANAVRQAWVSHATYIGEPGAPNHESGEQIRTDPYWSSVKDGALEYLRTDQASLDNEELLTRAHIALCDKVIEALKNSLDTATLAPDYTADGRPAGPPPRRSLIPAATT